MKILRTILSVAFVLIASVSAQAQINQLPHLSYYPQQVTLNDGKFKDAIKAYQSEVRGAMKSVSSRWIDSICAYTMLGEAYYAVGDFEKAIENYNAALNIYVQYYNWMLDVKFLSAAINPQTNRQLNIPWGFGARKKTLGSFPDTFSIQRGKVNQYDTVKHGGTVVMAHLIQVDVAEIWQCTALALYRRYELLGPLCKEDPLTDLCISKLSTRPAPPNHWSQTWVDVALGIAYLGAEKYDTAIPLLSRGIVCAGQFDHPLTAIAFLALARQAMHSGNNAAAVQYYHEATVAAVCYSRITSSGTILAEAFKGMSAAHLAGNPKTPCPALLPAIQWAKVKAGRSLQVVLNICMAENLLYFQKPADAAKYLKEAQARYVGRDFEISELGAKVNYSIAEMCYQIGKIQEGNAALAKSMEFMNHATPKLYQLDILNNLYQSGKLSIRSVITPRKAVAYYEPLLQSPSAEEWSLNPMNAFSSIANARPESYDNWFMLALEREEYQKAVMIADMGRRARFCAPMFAGGRLFNLRLLLEQPSEGLSALAKTQRQNILAEFPAYSQLQTQSQRMRDAIQKTPVVPEDAANLKNQTDAYKEWGNVARQQEAILYSMLLRRLPADLVFPPVITCEEIQKRLPEGEATLLFYNVRGRMFAFLIGKSQYATWEVKTIKKVNLLNQKLHKELSLISSTTIVDLSRMDDAWRTTAEELLTELLKDSKADFTIPFPGLAIVPDGSLWYVPFDLLQVKTANGRRPLIYQFKIRYAPTASLSVPQPIPTLGDVEWTFAQGRLHTRENSNFAAEAFDDILASASMKSALLKNQIPGPGQLLFSRLQRLVAWEDLNQDYNRFLDLHPLGIDSARNDGKLSDCLTLPYGAPQTILLPGFHTPEECSFKTSCRIPGFDLFFTSCALMAEGSQTILLSRWRTGGYSAQNLLKNYCKSIPKFDPASAWRVAVLKTAGSSAKLDKEPSVTGAADDNAFRMSHPYFWGGYMLFDSGVLPIESEQPENGGGIQFNKKN
ncbi:MAG: hypothetical protein IJQ39_13235 [Thermoguttaceae bacterium]|nr:hypothetical protein [Thermoguttaceae bacterium]